MSVSFLPAFEFMMENEDAGHECAVVPDLCPAAVSGPCFAISGINSGVWPDAFRSIQAKPQNERLPVVSAFYQSQYFNRYNIRALDSQDLANRVLDESVWSGPGTAIRLLQAALNALTSAPEPELACDGLMGPETVQAANGAGPSLVEAYRARRVAYLEGLAMYKNAPPKLQAEYRARASK